MGRPNNVTKRNANTKEREFAIKIWNVLVGLRGPRLILLNLLLKDFIFITDATWLGVDLNHLVASIFKL